MQMKINQKTKNAVKAKKASATSKVVKAVKAVKAKVVATVLKSFTAVALMQGVRGHAARLVRIDNMSDKTQNITALQNNLGLPLKDAHTAKIDNGILKGERAARIELGGYVNGKSNGTKVELLTPAQFESRSGKCIVHWNKDDNGIHGRYIGNPNVKGMVAVSVQYGKMTYYWQMEQDSNANNKHERGSIKPLKTGGKLLAV